MCLYRYKATPEIINVTSSLIEKMLGCLYLVVCLIALEADVATKDLDESRIVNGKLAKEGQFPFAVSLKRYDGAEGVEHVCTISLITSKTCLGAAHCVIQDGEAINVEEFCAAVGSLCQDTAPDCREFSDIYHHEEYEDDTTINDIALFILLNEVEFGETINTVRIAGPTKSIAGKGVIALGWGIMKLGGDDSRRLRYTFLHVRESSVCEEQFDSQLRDDQVCIYEENSGTCVGDSGGPIVLNNSNVQIALVSFGETECDTLPFVNTDIRKYTDWILEHSEGEPEVAE